MLTLLVVVLVVAVCFGGFGHSNGWGPAGWSPLGFVLVVLLGYLVLTHTGALR